MARDKVAMTAAERQKLERENETTAPVRLSSELGTLR